MGNNISISSSTVTNSPIKISSSHVAPAAPGIDPVLLAFELGKLSSYMEQHMAEHSREAITQTLAAAQNGEQDKMISAVRAFPPAIVHAAGQLALNTLSGILANTLS